MARILAHTSVHVRIDVALRYGVYNTLSPEEIKKRLLAEAAEIERLVKVHVLPEARSFGGFYVVFEEEHKCSRCGRPWTEKSTTYNGGCCAEDEKNAPPADVEAAP